MILPSKKLGLSRFNPQTNIETIVMTLDKLYLENKDLKKASRIMWELFELNRADEILFQYEDKKGDIKFLKEFLKKDDTTIK